MWQVRVQREAPLTIFFSSRYFHGSAACNKEVKVASTSKHFTQKKAFAVFIDKGEEDIKHASQYSVGDLKADKPEFNECTPY